jgi:YgiT-type zinc finger domain-containing protein
MESLLFRMNQHLAKPWAYGSSLKEDGETESGTTKVAFTRDETTIVIRDVPAQICTTSGEEYVDAETSKQLSQIVETAVNEGMYDVIMPRRSLK